ncbi:MAG: hypothetical protein ACE5I9_00085 [Candidatus Methylomirabilales bacterium]
MSLATQAFVRTSYGVLLFATLVITLPQGRRFFVSDRYGGYAKADPLTDRIQNPILLPFIMALWLLSAAMIALGHRTVLFCLINLLICRYLFIHMRWKGILRGMGAPGFMTYWLAACVFFLEYSLFMDPTGGLRPLALLAFKIDFAVIMLSAGLYKVLAGYRENEGMDFGMVNPWWGYWRKRYRKLPPNHVFFKTLNHLAYGTEIVAAILLLIPSTQFLGAMLIIGSFLFIATQIRLGFLCEMVVLAAFLYIDAGSLADRVISSFMPVAWLPAGGPASAPPFVNTVVGAFLWAYIALLPLAHAGLYYNFLWRRSLPEVLQRALESYTNFFGIIIWRVFSVDVVNFFVNIYIWDKTTGERELYSRVGAFDWKTRCRYLHVGEFISLASIFTTLKYYPTNTELFHERLMRYAKTISCPPGSALLFEYMSITKSCRCFEFLPVVEYVVDVHGQTVEERIINDAISVRAAHRVSPVHEGAYPGSYVPLGARKGSALWQ